MAGLRELGTLAGGAFGFLSGGGPQGAMTGASLGGQLGGMLSPEETLQRKVQPQAIAPQTALMRRQNQLSQNNLSQIRDSIDSLKYIKDDATRVALAKPLLQADYLARNTMEG